MGQFFSRIPHKVDSTAVLLHNPFKYEGDCVRLRVCVPPITVEPPDCVRDIRMSAYSPSEIVGAAEQQFLQRICIFSGIALLLYDTLLTLDHEIRLIWVRGRARMIALFLIIRHTQLLTFILNWAYSEFSSVSAQMCTYLSIVSQVFIMIPYLGWAAFLGWRAYALSSSNVLAGWLIFLCSATFVTPTAFFIIVAPPVYIETPPTCTAVFTLAHSVEIRNTLINVSRSLSLFAETVVLVLTLLKTRRAWLSSKRSNRPDSLPETLFQNGVLCFLIWAVLQATSIGLILNSNVSLANEVLATFTTLRDAIITVLLSHFILDLCKLGERESQTTRQTRGILTTEWMHDSSDVPSMFSIPAEYNGRGFEIELELGDFGKGKEV